MMEGALRAGFLSPEHAAITAESPPDLERAALGPPSELQPDGRSPVETSSPRARGVSDRSNRWVASDVDDATEVASLVELIALVAATDVDVVGPNPRTVIAIAEVSAIVPRQHHLADCVFIPTDPDIVRNLPPSWQWTEVLHPVGQVTPAPDRRLYG